MNLEDLKWEQFCTHMCSIINQVLDPDRRYLLLAAAHSEVPLLRCMHQNYYRLRDLPELPGQKNAMELLERDMTVLLALWQISRTSPNASPKRDRLLMGDNGGIATDVSGQELFPADAPSVPDQTHRNRSINLAALTYGSFYMHVSSILDQVVDPDQSRVLLTAAYSEVPLLESMHQEYHRLRGLPESPEQKNALELLERDLTVLLALWQISHTSGHVSARQRRVMRREATN